MRKNSIFTQIKYSKNVFVVTVFSIEFKSEKFIQNEILNIQDN